MPLSSLINNLVKCKGQHKQDNDMIYAKIRCSIKCLLFIECGILVKPNDSFPIRITLSNHFFDIRSSYFFTKFLCRCQKIFLRNKSLVIFVKVSENTLDVLLAISFTWLLSHQLYELFECYLTTIISIKD